MIIKLLVFIFATATVLSLWDQPLPRPITAQHKQLGLTLFSRSSELSKKVKELERQLMVLKKDRRPVGNDHIQRLWKELLWLWGKGALSRSKAMELYQLLTDIYWISNPKPATRQSDTHGSMQRNIEQSDTRGKTIETGNASHGKADSIGNDIQAQAKNIKQEIDTIASTLGTQSGFSETHYDSLKKKLDYLKNRGVIGLERHYQIIEERSPYAIAEADKKQKAEEAERKKRQENPYYDCPIDTPPPTLTADFTDFSALQMITPPGTLTGDRDVAKGHFWVWTGGARVPLYVPVDSVFESMTSGPASAHDSTIHYTLNFKVKDRCGYTFRFGHVTEPDTSLQPETKLSAGSRVAYTVGNLKSGNWDIGFYNRLKEGELAKINAFGLHRHGVCLIDYYPPDKRATYRALFDPNGPRRVCDY